MAFAIAVWSLGVVVIGALGALGHPVEALVEFGELVDLGAEEIGLIFDGLSLRVVRHFRGCRRRWGCRRMEMKEETSARRGSFLVFGWC